VLDLNLRGRKTYPIAEALLRRGIPFVLSTGYDTTDLPAEIRSVPIVQKPFQQQELEQALRQACML